MSHRQRQEQRSEAGRRRSLALGRNTRSRAHRDHAEHEDMREEGGRRERTET